LLVTWKTNDNIALSQELEIIDLSGYTAYYGSGKLYLLHKGFTTENLKAVLEKIDTDKNSILRQSLHLAITLKVKVCENFLKM
jgi:adenine-specific DNA-methyltransferase